VVEAVLVVVEAVVDVVLVVVEAAVDVVLEALLVVVEAMVDVVLEAVLVAVEAVLVVVEAAVDVSIVSPSLRLMVVATGALAASHFSTILSSMSHSHMLFLCPWPATSSGDTLSPADGFPSASAKSYAASVATPDAV
jgi:hypothetical protein